MLLNILFVESIYVRLVVIALIVVWIALTAGQMYYLSRMRKGWGGSGFNDDATGRSRRTARLAVRSSRSRRRVVSDPKSTAWYACPSLAPDDDGPLGDLTAFAILTEAIAHDRNQDYGRRTEVRHVGSQRDAIPRSSPAYPFLRSRLEIQIQVLDSSREMASI